MREHGTRTKFVHDGCRCLRCRVANADYEGQRQLRHRKGLKPFVDAAKAREHLALLRAHGVGLRRVSELSGVSRSALRRIARGETTQIRAATGRAICAVTPWQTAGGARVDAAETWALIEWMLDQGATKTWIARQLGSTAKTPMLQLRHDYVTKANADKVADLARRFGAGEVAA